MLVQHKRVIGLFYCLGLFFWALRDKVIIGLID